MFYPWLKLSAASNWRRDILLKLDSVILTKAVLQPLLEERERLIRALLGEAEEEEEPAEH